MIGKIALGTPFGASEEEREQLARSADTNVIDDEIKAVVLNLTEPDLSKRWNTIDLLSFLSQRTHLVDGARPLKHIFHDTLPVFPAADAVLKFQGHAQEDIPASSTPDPVVQAPGPAAADEVTELVRYLETLGIVQEYLKPSGRWPLLKKNQNSIDFASSVIEDVKENRVLDIRHTRGLVRNSVQLSSCFRLTANFCSSLEISPRQSPKPPSSPNFLGLQFQIPSIKYTGHAGHAGHT
jgi:hypothetical protein